jgi:hypothetical protein
MSPSYTLNLEEAILNLLFILVVTLLQIKELDRFSVNNLCVIMCNTSLHVSAHITT